MVTHISKRVDVLVERHFINLAYLGAPFHGWQIQPNAVSVQEVVEGALSTLFRTKIAIVGAGRTDAGVNASMMIAHVDLPRRVDDCTAMVRALNGILGPNIMVRWIRPVHADAHARFDATARTYRYYAHVGRDPFAGPLSWQAPEYLDFAAMNEAAKVLLETEDFTSFSKLHTDVKTNICHVAKAEWTRIDTPRHLPGAERWMFEITADRFLRNMVRAVVGTLVEVGRGKMDVNGFRDVIERRNRCAAGTSMPGEPLFLHDVKYPYTI